MTTRCLLLTLVVLSVTAVQAAEPTGEELEFFEKKIRPLLVQSCYKCHSAESEELGGGLLLDSKPGWKTGGESGPAIAPGDPDDSLLIQAVRYEGLEMPPDGQLSEQQVADLTHWIKLGAPDPRNEATTSLIKRTIDLEEGRKFWAFVPPKSRLVPAVKDRSWPRTDIDRFVLAAQEARGIHPVGDAQRRILARRLYFDLIGLPPTPEQLAEFVADSSPNAVAKLVDELLASEHFGERWGRHWLDVARYSESSGMERNVTFPQAWRYRDWVIAAVNADKPYDAFIREQIAGDLLPAATNAERTANVIATGFLAMGPKSLNERNRNVFQMDIVDEQIDITTRAVLAVTVSCARCHDHKFDPFPTTDYYAMAGIFRSTDTLYGTGKVQGNRQPAPLAAIGEDGDAKVRAWKEHQQAIAKLEKQIASLSKGKQKNPKKNKKQAADEDAKAARTAQKEKLQALQQQLKELNTNAPPEPQYAMGVADGTPADCRVHIRGNVETLGGSVPRGYLSVVSLDGAPAVDPKQSGRLQLAEWLTSREQPLTARVMANRIWQHLFGQGLVRTTDNFGAQGETPANPELLDHLAIRFMEQGWSVKQLIREIVLSRVYQLSSEHDDVCFSADPENLLCWQMAHRRLDVEAIRDAILADSGKLDRSPVRASVVAKIGDVNVGRDARSDKLLDAEDLHRSVYLPILRNRLPEMLRCFDFAEPSIIVGRRDVTTVPTQALYLMNSPFILEQSAALADRLLKLSGDDAARIDRAYWLTLSRAPTKSESARAGAFIKSCAAQLDARSDQQRSCDAWASLCQALFASAEFRYVE